MPSLPTTEFRRLRVSEIRGYAVVGEESGRMSEARSSSGAAGSEIVNTVPPPAAGRTSMSPPCSRTMAMQILSPRPVPRPGRLVVKKGSKTLGRISGGIRGPAGLLVNQFELAARPWLLGPLAEHVADGKDGGERVIELVGHTGDHLPHGGELFRLQDLLFEAVELGDVTGGSDDAGDAALRVFDGAGHGAEQTPGAIL